MIINHIDLPYGFNVGSREPIDARFILSKADMAKVGDATQGDEFALPRWPEHYFVLCEDDGQIYEFHKDAAAPNGCVFTKLTRRIDNKTVLENANLEIYIPIDEQTIILSEGVLKAVPEQLIDGVATKAENLPDGTAKVDVVYDPLTLVVALNNELGVKYDHDTLKVDSEGLFVDFAAHVDDVTIKYDSEKLVAQYKADEEKGLHLDGVEFEVKVDNDSIKFNSEGELAASFLRYEGEHGVEVTSEGKIRALTDDATIKVVNDKLEVQAKEAVGKDADGLFIKYDGHTVVLNAAEELNVPVQDLVHVDSEGPLELDKSVADELTIKLRHDDTLEVTSEGKLHAVARQAVASEGIIVVPEGETSIISVDFDHETILLGSEGLYVNVMPKQGLEMARGAGNKPLGFKVKVDGSTVSFNSEGALQSTSTPLVVINPLTKTTAPDGTITLDVKYDGKTVLVNTSEGLYVPIDKDSIFVDVDGKIKAKKQLGVDNLTIVENSEILSVNLDNKTLITTNGVVETAIGGWVENPSLVTFADGSYTGTAPIFTHIGGGVYRFEGIIGAGMSPVPQDGQLVDIKLDLKAGGTTVSKVFNGYTFIDYGTTISTGDGTPTDELRNFTYEKATGKYTIELMPTDTTLFPVIGGLDVNVSGVTGVYHTVDAKFIPVDGTSIVVKNGKLVTSAPSITAGDALEYVITTTANTLNVLADSETISIRDNKLYAPILTDHTAAEADLVLTINSEGKPEFLKRAGVVDVVIDSESMVTDYVATIPAATDAKRGVVKFDNDTIVLNSEGQLKVVNLTEDVLVKELLTTNVTSEGVRTKVTSEGSILVNRVAKLDLTPYAKLAETGYRIELFMDGEPAPSEGGYDSESSYILKARLLDQAGNVLTTSNPIDLPLESMIVDVTSTTRPLTSETTETILIFTLKNGKKIEIPLGSIVGGFVRQHADYLGINSIDGRWNFSNELYNHDFEVINVNQTDGTTLYWNDSENYLTVLPYKTSEGLEIVTKNVTHQNMAGDTITTPEYTIGVKFDHETIVLNSEQELSVPVDKKTLVLDAGKVVANIDEQTIIYDDSEGKIKLPLDGVTIYLNSENVLEAAGLDVKAGEAIEISNSEEGGLPVKYINVLYDNETVMLNSENELYIPLDYETIIVDSENKVALPIDRKTIFIDSESGLLKAAGLTVSEGEAIKITTSEVDGVEQAIIDVRYDDETILINSENELYVPLDYRTVIIDSEGKVALPLDNKTIFIDSETNLIKAAGLVVSEGLAIEIENSELDGVAQAIINVKYDELAGLEVNSENELFVKLDLQSLKFNSEGEAYAHLDEETIILDSEGAIHAKIDYDTLIINSEGFIAVDRLTVPEVDAIWRSIVI